MYSCHSVLYCYAAAAGDNSGEVDAQEFVAALNVELNDDDDDDDGKNALSYNAFALSMFELAEHWAEELTEVSIQQVLGMLFREITSSTVCMTSVH